MRAQTDLLPNVVGRRAFIRRVSDPEEVPGVVDPEQRDDSVVLLEGVLGDRVKAPVAEVRRAVFEAVADEYPLKAVTFCRTLAEVHVRLALDHWQTPFGLDFKTPGAPESLLLYRGGWYIRRKGGRLSWLQDDEFTPQFSEWCSNLQFAKVIVRSGLRGGERS